MLAYAKHDIELFNLLPLFESCIDTTMLLLSVQVSSLVAGMALDVYQESSPS